MKFNVLRKYSLIEPFECNKGIRLLIFLSFPISNICQWVTKKGGGSVGQLVGNRYWHGNTVYFTLEYYEEITILSHRTGMKMMEILYKVLIQHSSHKNYSFVTFVKSNPPKKKENCENNQFQTSMMHGNTIFSHCTLQ